MKLLVYQVLLWTVMGTAILPEHSTALKLQRDWEALPLNDLEGEIISAPQGSPYFKILNKINGSVYVGGNETLVQLSINNRGEVDFFETQLVTQEDPGLTVTCEQRNPSNHENVCWNFIRIAEKTQTGQLLVCGTNAYSGECYLCQQGETPCDNVVRVQTSSSKVNIVPFSPFANPSSAIFARGDEDVLYTTSSSEAVFERYSANITTTNSLVELELRSSSVQGKFLNAPVFVGKPFDYTDDVGSGYIFFFFREMALEYGTFEKKQYSRIARVCRNDTGDSATFTTFVKALLNCSVPDTLLPFYYSEIQDVVWNGEEAYAVFTSQTLGPNSSAMCRYRMTDIMKLFDEGVFKEQVNTNSEWLPTPKLNPRPGTCNEDHSTTENPLMDKPVPNYNPDDPTDGFQESPPSNFNMSAVPMFYVDGVRFTSLAIDFENSVYFFGTAKGSVIKYFDGNTVEVNELGTSGPVTGLKLLEKENVTHLVITTENNVVRWSLNTQCSARSQKECDVVKSPYCKWLQGQCVCTRSNSICQNGQANVFVQPASEKIDSCDNSVIFLYCEVDGGPYFHGNTNLSWVKENNDNFIKNNTHLVEETQLSDKLLELKVMVHELTKGKYTCMATMEANTYNKTVDINHISCLTTGNLAARCNEYNSLQEERQKIEKEGGTCNLDFEDCNTCRLGYSTATPPK